MSLTVLTAWSKVYVAVADVLNVCLTKDLYLSPGMFPI